MVEVTIWMKSQGLQNEHLRLAVSGRSAKFHVRANARFELVVMVAKKGIATGRIFLQQSMTHWGSNLTRLNAWNTFDAPSLSWGFTLFSSR